MSGDGRHEAGHRPSWTGGVAAALRKWREATLAPQTGWWFRFKEILSILNHHPVRSIKGSFAIFFFVSRPPLLARRGDGALLSILGRFCGLPFDGAKLRSRNTERMRSNRCES
jgi:hypothetical protein